MRREVLQKQAAGGGLPDSAYRIDSTDIEAIQWNDAASWNYDSTVEGTFYGLGCTIVRSQVPFCPADYDGCVTKGDPNERYDQAVGRSDVVKTEWIRGVAKVRVPWLGCIRLELSGNFCF